MEHMRHIAYETVLRACGFGSLAIFCVMIGMSFEPRLAFQAGGTLTKIMPPLKGKTEYRRFAVEKGWKVCECNDIANAVLPIDYDYYVQEVEKLCLGVM